jgi:GNAT superfamily N-acetyltransferase
MENNINDIEIMAAKPEDARSIQDLKYRSWLITYPDEASGITLQDIQFRLKDALTDEKISKLARQIANASGDENFFVAKVDEGIVGYCHVVKYPNKNQLHAIYVLPEQVWKGIGTKLWKAAQDFFDPEKDTYVDVATYNENAIRFYKKLGFTETGRVFSDEKFRMQSGSIITETELVIKPSLSDQT